MKNIITNNKIVYLLLFIILHFFIGCGNPELKFDEARSKMVKTQIEDRGIVNKEVIKAMATVKRHKFVPKELEEKAYGDFQLEIGFDQTITQPYIVAFMTELLKLNKNSKVLEIGTGSGYQAAVISILCKEVYTVEIVSQLSNKAQGILKNEGYNNISFKIGDGYQGWKENAPFDAIIVTCAPENIPPALEEQLAEGGTMIIPVGRSYVQKLVLIKKLNGQMSEQTVLPVRFVPMVDEDGNLY